MLMSCQIVGKYVLIIHIASSARNMFDKNLKMPQAVLRTHFALHLMHSYNNLYVYEYNLYVYLKFVNL